jgi:2-polyprenyl-6-methoxyphenol hydroxylase-like FAD-dependent oxidoreductase
MKNHDVVIAGGGPTGLMLAGELALAKVDVAIVERRASQALAGSRAGGLHARTIELLDQRGIAERFVSQGKPVQVNSLGGIPLDISDFPTRHAYSLGLWQNRIEELLAQWVLGDLNVPIYRGLDVTGFTEGASDVDIQLSDGKLRAQWLVGCDGGRSIVRKIAGIEFPGHDASVTYIIAEAKADDDPLFGVVRHDDKGTYAIGKLEDGYVRAVIRDSQVTSGDEPSLEDLRKSLREVYGKDFDIREPRWISRFSDMTRQAAKYRAGRVFLAGDAAHVHAPNGGQGLNIGVHDAVNLGWKLARVVNGISPASLLDTYHAERHPIGARVLKMTMAQTTLGRGDARTEALREILGEVMKVDEARRRTAAMLAGLDVHYDFGAGHPLLGRRMPDLDLGERRVYSLLHDAKPVLLNFSKPISVATSNDIERVDARHKGIWELPAIGRVQAPTAVLIRPDGYVAWVGEGTETGLRDAITKWFGDGAAAAKP